MKTENFDKNNETKEHGPNVSIFIDNVERLIHRGHQSVVAIKEAGKVPIAYDLEQIIEGTLTPLPDDGAITIKGEEKFVSHPKDSGSS